MAAVADLAFVNGDVYTVDPARPWARAVAVSEGRIVAVGDDEEIREVVGPETEVVDLAGRALFPGFQDAHVHPASGGLEMLRCNLSDAYTVDAYLEMVAEYAAANPGLEWITGGGWYMDAFPGGNPPAAALDRVLPDRPAYLSSRDGHTAWVNTRAFELAGVTSATADPVDGWIVRGADGTPWGALHEGAMDLVHHLLPEDTTEDWLAGLRVGQQYLHSLGITAWQDAIVGLGRGVGDVDASFDAYVRFAEDGSLTARVVGAMWWDHHRGLEQVEELLEARDRGRVGRFVPSSVKIMQDGVLENFTAGMVEPYLDDDGLPTRNRGKSFVEPDLLKECVTRLDAEGFQVHFHAIGDRAVREALDAVEAARRANGPNDLRHHIAHIQVIQPSDIPRFAELGVVANAQPLWASYDGQMQHLTIPFLGPERSGWQYPFGSLARAGATLAGGSDWSVSSPDPLAEIHIAVNRLVPQEYRDLVGDVATTEVFLPDERIDLATAVRMFTMGSAYVNHLDDVTGSIEVGKYADLTVLDRNPFDAPASEILRARVVLTMVEGRRVYTGDGLD